MSPTHGRGGGEVRAFFLPTAAATATGLSVFLSLSAVPFRTRECVRVRNVPACNHVVGCCRSFKKGSGGEGGGGLGGIRSIRTN